MDSELSNLFAVTFICFDATCFLILIICPSIILVLQVMIPEKVIEFPTK